MQEDTFYYIVIETNGKQCFVSKELGQTDDFDRALRFFSREAAEDYLLRLPSDGSSVKILPYVT